jgi:hypothetical protein
VRLTTPRFSGRGPHAAMPVLSTGYRPLASCPAQRAGAQRLCAVAPSSPERRHAKGQVLGVDPTEREHRRDLGCWPQDSIRDLSPSAKNDPPCEGCFCSEAKKADAVPHLEPRGQCLGRDARELVRSHPLSQHGTRPSDRFERARKGKKRPRGARTPSIFWIRAILNSPLRLSTGSSPSNVIATASQKSRQSRRRPDEATGPDQDQHHG